MLRLSLVFALAASPLLFAACGSTKDSPPATPTDDAGDAGMVAFDSGPTWGLDANSVLGDEPPVDAAKPTDDSGSYPLCDGGSMAADRFVTSVVSFDPGSCAGFGQAEMPGIVEGPPVGGGPDQGGLDVVSLGHRGSIVVSFAPGAIVDGPGADFIVFENAFYVEGNVSDAFVEPGEVSVSDDGTTWTTFPCATSAPYAGCAGVTPVYSNPDNCVSPLDPSVSGGDAFDLSTIGVTHARFVRIVDETNEACAEAGAGPLGSNGFDLDAVSVVHEQ